MGTFQCIDDECGHRWYEKSRLAVDPECIECGGTSVEVGGYDEYPAEINAVARRLEDDVAHTAFARERARKLLVEHRILAPPIPIPALARLAGFDVTTMDLGKNLRARLRGTTIEVNCSETFNGGRFSIAHELGHHYLKSSHGDEPRVETEADAFAGELLVPGHMLRSAMQRTTDIAELSRQFQASRDAIEIAAKNHKLLGSLTFN